MPKTSTGRIVNFYPASNQNTITMNGATCFPALINQVIDESTVNLSVFTPLNGVVQELEVSKGNQAGQRHWEWPVITA